MIESVVVVTTWALVSSLGLVAYPLELLTLSYHRFMGTQNFRKKAKMKVRPFYLL